MFSNGREMTEYQILQDNDDDKAIAIPRVFSENSRANKAHTYQDCNARPHG